MLELGGGQWWTKALPQSYRNELRSFMALESGREKAVGSASAMDSNADDFTDVDTNSTIHDGGVDDDDVCGRGRRTTF